MLNTTRKAAIRLASRGSQLSLPDFLIPSLLSDSNTRPFSSSPECSSRIGAAPLSIPPEVNIRLLDIATVKANGIPNKIKDAQIYEVEGPLGKLSIEIPPFLTFAHNTETRKGTLSIDDKKIRKHREMWGTTRAVFNNHILGVSEGHSAILRLVGVGFRATIEKTAATKQPDYPGQEFVSLKVGYSHPIELGIPLGVKASTPQPTRILLEGSDKEVVKQFAAEIREWRKPEPYKGKGIFVDDETIRLKSKKIK